MGKPIVFVDIDGVLADLHSVWLYRYNNEYDDNLKSCDIHDWDISKFVRPICGKNIFKYLDDPYIYDHVMPIYDSLDGIMVLSKIAQIVYCTTATPATMGKKFYWLRDNGFPVSVKTYMETGDKSLVNGNILIDDCYNNVKKFKGLGILFSQPWNILKEYSPRCFTWDCIVDEVKNYASL